MKKLSNKGFSAVEGLLVLVFVGLIGFVGWYVWHSRATSSTKSVTNNAVIVPNGSSKPGVVNEWTGQGGDLRWSNAKNWSKGALKNNQDVKFDFSKFKQPVNGDQMSVTNDYTGLTIHKLIFTGSVKGTIFDVTGQKLIITGGIEDSVMTAPKNVVPQISLDVDVELKVSQTINVSSSNSGTDGGSFDIGLIGNKSLDFGQSTITITTTNKSSVGLMSRLRGNGKLVVDGDVTVGYDSSAFSGAVNIVPNAILTAASSKALGTATINVASGATLTLLASHTHSIDFNNDVILSGMGVEDKKTNAIGNNLGAISACITQTEEGCDTGVNVNLTGQIMLAGDAKLGATKPCGDKLFGECGANQISTTSVTYNLSKPVKGGYSLDVVDNSHAKIAKK